MPTEKDITDWLLNTGFPLEMEVATILRKRGLSVLQADYYLDPKSNEYREIDVVAITNQFVERQEGHLLRFEILCECKTSRDKPWLFFVDDSAQPMDRLLMFNRPGNRFASRLLTKAADRLTGDLAPLFAFDRAPAYGVIQGLRKKQNDLDTSYAALMQVANAARVRAEDSELTFKDMQGSLNAEAFIAVVVVDGKLFDVKLGEDWAPSITEVERQVVMWRNPVVGRPFTVIHVVGKDRLGAFVSSVQSAIEALYRWCDENPERVRDAFRSPLD
jgi:hypothetical protein